MMAELRPYVSKRRKISEPVKDATNYTSNETGLSKESTAAASNDKATVKTVTQDQIKDVKRARKSNYFLPKQCIKKFSLHKNAVNHVRWSNDVQSSLLLSASLDGTMLLFKWNKASSEMVQKLTVHSGAVKDARWNSDGKKLVSGGYDKHAKITDTETGKEVFSHKFKDFVTSVLYHPTLSEVLLCGTSSSGIFAIDAKTGKEIHHYKSFCGQVQDLLFHPDNKTFFSAAEILKRNSMDKAVIAWDFETTAIVSNQISQEVFGCSCLQLHPYEPVFLAQYGTGYISIFSTMSPYKLNKYKRFEGHQTASFNIGFSVSPDGSCVISGDREGAIHIYDYSSSRLVKTFTAYNSACMDVSYHPILPNVVASCSWDGEVSFWE